MSPSRKPSKFTCAVVLIAVLASIGLYQVLMVATGAPATPTETLTVPIIATDTPSSGTAMPVLTDTPLVVTVTSVPGLEIIPMYVGYGVRGSWFELYFTDSTHPNASQETGGSDAPLVEAINQARLSVDVAVYSLNLYSVRKALIDAHQRGVTVRVVIESDNMDTSAVDAIIEAGIPVLGDRRQGLMHNKFVVIDHSDVWLGSINFTYAGVYDDNNNMIRIHSIKIAENYTKEFEEMFVDDQFGPDDVPATPNPVVTIDGVRVENYFSPDDHVASHIIQLLNGAEESIYFMAYAFTSDDFGRILIQKAAAGLTVKGVFDTEQYNASVNYCEYDLMRELGLDVHLDGNPGLMHHKVFIIDSKIVILGSYNFSANAENTNDENVIIIFNPDIAAQYLVEFQRVYAQANP